MNIQKSLQISNKLYKLHPPLFLTDTPPTEAEDKYLDFFQSIITSTHKETVQRALRLYTPIIGSSQKLYITACWWDFRKLRDFIARENLLPTNETLGGKSNLSLAVHYNDTAFAKKEIESSRDVNTTTDPKFLYLLEIAADHGNLAMIRLLLSYMPQMQAQDALVYTIASRYFYLFKIPSPEEKNDRYQIACLLIKQGASVFAKVKLGEKLSTLLEAALRPEDCYNNLKLAKLLEEVIRIKRALNSAIRLLLIGQRDPQSALSLFSIDCIKKINDMARYTLVVEWAEEAMRQANYTA